MKYPVKNNNFKKFVLIVVVATNAFLIGNTMLTGWSFLWPKVSGQIISEEITPQTASLRKYDLRNYMLSITYSYSWAGFPCEHKASIDVFDSKQTCEEAAARYHNQAIPVYVNPLNYKISTINPGHNFINALIACFLTMVLTALLYYILTRRSSNTGMSTNWTGWSDNMYI